MVAFTPKGGCPLKPQAGPHDTTPLQPKVAFTPKGGCPLKREEDHIEYVTNAVGSIHPQGWVPVETTQQTLVW